MVQLSEKYDLKEATREIYKVKTLENSEDAKRIIDFLLSENSFDDRNFTEGEILMMNSLPIESLEDSGFQFWYTENMADEIIGIISVRENEQKSGGHCIDYLVVHKQYRNRGIAMKLLEVVTQYVQLLKGRYIQVNTCDTSLYVNMRKLLEKRGFFPSGLLPDYYFEGEAMVIYYKKI